ncbi:MAG: GreA/GreB family elongation factor [Deltaproteobacteria bacterium]|nr:GreA/GreB family elongation factor [Deltaproteobacteria bacterium]
MALDKTHFLAALVDHYEAQLGIARKSAGEAMDAAAHLATESEKREDGRAAIEFGSLAKGQAQRAQGARDALEILERVGRGLQRFDRRAAVELGALVDVRTETEAGCEERTFFLLPVGAGTELTGPHGDGFVSVITPSSPVGKALLGKRVGETFDVTIKGDAYEWRVVDLS